MTRPWSGYSKDEHVPWPHQGMVGIHDVCVRVKMATAQPKVVDTRSSSAFQVENWKAMATEETTVILQIFGVLKLRAIAEHSVSFFGVLQSCRNRSTLFLIFRCLFNFGNTIDHRNYRK